MVAVLVTGSSGLLGSECVLHFDSLGYSVHGVDGDHRRDFFGPDGDTGATLQRLQQRTRHYSHHRGDVRDRAQMASLVETYRPSLVIHCAAQPSHDLAALRPFDDFEVNAVGTLNLLEAVRQHAPDAVFCFASTNKVYGDRPNRLPLVEKATRYEIAPTSPAGRHGIGEWMDVDQSLHSLFGCSKLAADLLVQEYGRNFGMKTGCFRFGCITGGAHAGAERHGFLAYLARCAKEGRSYKVYGHKGKQVRDQLHARDAARAFELFAASPRPGQVYNLGGGWANSTSVVEAIGAVEQAAGVALDWQYVDEPRPGDHVVYYSDTYKFQTHYPSWGVTTSLASIIEELC